MGENNGYLKFLINEPIYLVKESGNKSVVEKKEVIENKPKNQSDPKEATATSESSSSVAEPQPQQDKAVVQPKMSVIPVPTKKLLVIYQFEASETLPIHLKKLMLKIIEAVGIDVMQGVYVNLNFKEIPALLTDFENVLIFSSSAELPFDGFQKNTPYETQIFGNTRVLVSDTLLLLDEQIPLKRKLWGILQKMFPKA
jgi:hypothetical protein